MHRIYIKKFSWSSLVCKYKDKISWRCGKYEIESLFLSPASSIPILMNSIPNSSHIENVQSIGNEYGSAAVRATLMLFRIRTHSKEKSLNSHLCIMTDDNPFYNLFVFVLGFSFVSMVLYFHYIYIDCFCSIYFDHWIQK